MSVPSSAQTCTAYRLGGWPRTACTPAEATSMSLRLPISRRKSPSAIGLRQILPVQTNVETLRQVPLFESLDDEAARELCELLESLDRKVGAVLFRAGDEGDA